MVVLFLPVLPDDMLSILIPLKYMEFCFSQKNTSFAASSDNLYSEMCSAFDSLPNLKVGPWFHYIHLFLFVFHLVPCLYVLVFVFQFLQVILCMSAFMSHMYSSCCLCYINWKSINQKMCQFIMFGVLCPPPFLSTR